MPNILVNNNFYQGTSEACIVDITPPTFSGINFLDVESRGQIRAGWSAASDPTPPIRYEVYIQANTASGLFNISNIVAVTPNLQFDIFTLPDGSFLQNGTTYHVGVRAIDGVNNRDSNTVSQNVISTGVLTAIDTYEANAVFSIDRDSNLRGTIWANKNDSLAISPNGVVGLASYEVFDRSGNPVSGLSQTGISANSEGLFIISSVASTLLEALDHYTVKVSVIVDGEERTNFVAIQDKKPKYEINGIPYRQEDNIVVGSFWVSRDEELVAQANLGTASYQVYGPDGNPIIGLSESGIIADVNGIFKTTPFTLPPAIDPKAAYSVRITLEVDGKIKSDFITIDAQAEDYSPKAQFSINGLNQLQGTFWALRSGEAASPTILGTASYEILDKNGNPVSGLSQTGLVADSNGLFHTTPVSAILLTDLTHYTAKISMMVGGVERTAYKGFSLLGN